PQPHPAYTLLSPAESECHSAPEYLWPDIRGFSQNVCSLYFVLRIEEIKNASPGGKNHLLTQRHANTRIFACQECRSSSRSAEGAALCRVSGVSPGSPSIRMGGSGRKFR